MRISRSQMLMEVAQVVAKRGTCSRKQVGAIVARDGRVLVTGYNGAPAGMAHCEHDCDCGYPGEGGLLFEGKHLSGCISLTPCDQSVHAEANAVAFAARHGIRLEGGEMYTTCSPCVACAKLLVNAGLIAVICAEAYRDESGLNLLRDARVEVGVLR